MTVSEAPKTEHRVLLVDDDRNLLEGLCRTLHGEPYTVLTAESATEGLRMLRENLIDVVIADYDMPGMDGADFLFEVRAIHPRTVRFMLTGKPSLDLACDAVNRGAIVRFFVKPCDTGELARAIRQALNLENEAGDAGE